MDKDEPIPEMIALVKALSQARDVRLVYVAGRPDSHREMTAYWLADHLGAAWTGLLYMRKAGDHRPDHTVKAEILRHLRGMGYDRHR
jgi:hypothetical protein